MLNSTNKITFLKYSLFGLFVITWIWSSISPFSRHDWILENLLVIIILAVLILTYKKFKFSDTSYIMIFIFLILHEFGAHYTYSLVPYDEWLNYNFGFTINGLMGWERNHFDRFIHLIFGILWAYPAKEFFARKLSLSNNWSWFFAMQSVMSFSLLYELIEWLVAVVFGGELGMQYLGTQGDIWDAHKDMLLATIGAGISIVIDTIIKYSHNINTEDKK